MAFLLDVIEVLDDTRVALQQRTLQLLVMDCVYEVKHAIHFVMGDATLAAKTGALRGHVRSIQASRDQCKTSPHL